MFHKFKKNPKFYWAAFMAIALTIFFFVDLSLYWGVGPEATLSASLRGTLATEPRDIFVALGGFICGVWFSHFFQFGHRPPDDDLPE